MVQKIIIFCKNITFLLERLKTDVLCHLEWIKTTLIDTWATKKFDPFSIRNLFKLMMLVRSESDHHSITFSCSHYKQTKTQWLFLENKWTQMTLLTNLGTQLTPIVCQWSCYQIYELKDIFKDFQMIFEDEPCSK